MLAKPHFRHLLFLLPVFVLLLVGLSLIPRLQAEEEVGSELVALINAGLERDREEPTQLTPLSSTPCVGGMAGIYPCQNMDLLSFMPLNTIGNGNGSANWGWTDPVSGREFAIMGRSNGTAFVEITNPTAPVYLGNLPTHTGNSSWRELKTYNNYVFVVSDSNGAHGMQVFDLNQLLTVASPPVTFASSAHYSGVTRGHTITTNEATGYAFIFGSNICSGGLHFVNVANPLAPVSAGCFSADGYTHDAQCEIYHGPDVAHQGKEICWAYNEDTLTIVNVTNKATPVQISRTPYAGSRYTHQGWLTDDHQYLVMDDELDEQQFGHFTRTYLWDVRDLDAPVMMGYFQSNNPSIDHNQYFQGDYLFQANYRAGVRMLDGSNVANAQLSEIGYFDIYPANNNANFNGAWHVYPYFPSGTIIVSGIEQGLFMLQPHPLFTMDNTFDVCQGSNDHSKLYVSSGFGLNATVNLATQGLPAGATPSFGANPVTSPDATQLVINVTSAAVGNYPFTVTGSNGTITRTVNMTLNVLAGNLATPTLVSPANGATGQPVQPTLTWAAATGATAYNLQVATDAGFTNVVLTANGVTGTSYTPASALNNGTTYYWRVQASGDCGLSSYSTARSFTTIEAIPSAPTLITPANGATDQPLQPTFTWNAAAGATSYAIQVATDAGFANVVLSANNISGTTYTPTTNLTYETTYYWRVLATNGAGSSPYSAAFSFTTLAPPATPTIYLPIIARP